MVRSFAIALLFINTAFSQSTPFLTDNEIRMLSNEISGDRAFEHIRVLSQWHRNSGMEGYFKAADYIMQAARDAGLEDVKFIEQPLRGKNYTARSAELWMIEPIEVKLADIGDHAVHLADGSHDADVTAECIWIENPSKDFLKDIDVEGKIVLTNASLVAAVRNAVWGKGAIGVVAYHTAEGRNPMDFPDQIAWSSIPSKPPEGKQGTFAFVLSPRKGDMLRQILTTDNMQDVFATGKKSKGGRAFLRAKVDTEFGDAPGRTGFVEGWIKGSTYRDQQIVVTAHLQEEQGSANDDGSGCGNILEIARTLNKLIKEGKIERPLRDIRFWWTDEIYSEYRYFRDHPEEVKKFLANIHQDMVGANQQLGSRVQHLIFAPHSRTSYLDAIFESIGNYVILTNNGFLSASRQGGYPRPFTRPMYATRGTRAGYNARFVPYFGNSDHMCFVEGVVGVPAAATINWDDDYIHSSDDDLWQIDQTQLKRNAFLMGSMMYALAFIDNHNVSTLASETFAQGVRRLANDLQVAIKTLHDSAAVQNDGWSDAAILIEQGILREQRAVRSARVFAGADRSSIRQIEEMVERMKEKESGILEDLRTLYRQIHRKSPRLQLTDAERAASKKIPANNPSLTEYFDNRDSVRFSSGLHGLMRSEVYNFVDGRRSYYDIYKGVRAEQLAAGSWYYGTVTLKDVVGLLDAAVEKDVLRLLK